MTSIFACLARHRGGLAAAGRPVRARHGLQGMRSATPDNSGEREWGLRRSLGNARIVMIGRAGICRSPG